MDELGGSRARMAACVSAAVAALSLPTVLFEPVLGWEDFVFGQFWLPIGALAICIFTTRRCGWGYEAFAAEASAGSGMGFPRFYGPIMKWLVPLLILAAMAVGIADRLS